MLFNLRSLLRVLILLMAVAPATAETINLVTEEYPPYNMSGKDKVVIGVSTDIVRELMNRAGFRYEIKIYPWARAIRMARLMPNTCVFSMSRMPEREQLYQWVGPLVHNDWSLFAKRTAAPLDALDTVRNARFGTYQGDAIVAWMQAHGYQVDVAPSDEDNPNKLLAGHIDYWVTGKLFGQYLLRQMDLDSMIAPVLTFNRTDMYLACQKSMPATNILKLNRQFALMQKDGTVGKIYASYGYEP